MNGVYLLVIFWILMMTTVTSVQAVVSVDISNTVNTSNTNVNMNQSNPDTSTTEVKIEVNGELKTFNAQGNESIDYQSEDGLIRVNVNNDSSNDPEQSPLPTNHQTELNARSEVATLSPTLLPEINLNDEPKNIIEAFLELWHEWNTALNLQLRKIFE